MGDKKAGAIPIYESEKIVLVSNKKGHLIMPKGGVKKKETLQEASLREAKEEGGIEGEIVSEFSIDKKGYTFFILKVINLLEDYEEKDVRSRVILSYDEVINSSLVPSYVKEILFSYKKNKDENGV